MAQTNTTRTIEPFSYQRAFIDPVDRDKRYYGYISGVGAGKTFAGIIRTIHNMRDWNPGEMGAILAPTRQMVVNVIIPEMRDLGLFDPPIDWEYHGPHADKPGIHTPDDSRALILSADNQRTIERLRGLNLAWGWIDEEAVVDPRARQILMQRLRTGKYRNMYITTTPKGHNHTYDFFVGDVDAVERRYGEATIYETDDRLAIVGVPTDANEHTPSDYKAAMKADLPDEVRAQEVEGQFVEMGAGLLTHDMLQREPASVLNEQTWQWHVAVDLGVETDSRKARQNDTDYWALAIVAEHPRKPRAYLCDVVRRRGQSPAQAADWIREATAWVPTDVVKYEAVQAQSWFESDLKDAGLRPIPYTPDSAKEDRILHLSVLFNSGKVKLIDWDGFDHLDVDWTDFEREWVAFPDGDHDDQLDAVAQALEGVRFGGVLDAIGGDMYGRDRDDR